jgi:hypothetical protein
MREMGSKKKTAKATRRAEGTGRKKKASRSGRKKTAKKASRPAAGSVALITRTAEAAVARNRQKGLDSLALIRRRQSTIAEAFYDIALALQILQRKEIYAALGASSFAEIVETHTTISRSLAFELVKIPVHLSREAAVHMKREGASALIAFVEATPTDDAAEHLFRADAAIGGRPLSEQTALAIEQAARKARPKRKKRDLPGEQEALAIINAAETHLERTAKRDLVMVVTRRKDGWWARVELPIDLLARVEIGAANKKTRPRAKRS